MNFMPNLWYKRLIAILLVVGLISCKSKQLAIKTKNYYTAYYEQKDFALVGNYLADSITIVEGEYQMPYSAKTYYTMFQWDSVFQPCCDVLEVLRQDTQVVATVATYSSRFEFLGNNPLTTKQRLSFTDGKIVQIEILDYIEADFTVWAARRDTLVAWIDVYQPELSGFVYDMTKTGAENYLKAIALFQKAALKKKD